MSNSLIEMIKNLGFPMAVALLLLMALMGWLPSPVLQSIVTQTQALKSHADKDAYRDIILWQICENTGKTPGSCLKPWKEN